MCITKLELSTYGHGFALEIIFAFSFAVIGAVIKSVGKIAILCKTDQLLAQVRSVIPVLFSLTVVVQALSGIAGILAVTVHVPVVAIYSYVMLIVSGVAVNVVSALTIDLYPTTLR